MSEHTILRSRTDREPPSAGRASASNLDRGIDIGGPGEADGAARRGRLYGLTALGLERPGDDFEAAIEDGGFTDRLLESAEEIDADIAAAARAVGNRLATVPTLRREWASLFGVEEGITVSPYQLTYIPGPLMTNVRKLADIRGFYSAFGLSVVPGQNDRGDHICFLTEFMGHLCTKEAVLRRKHDSAGVSVVVDAQGAFIEDHLGRWYWRFAEEVNAYDDCGFYAAIASLLAALVEYDIDRYGLEPDWVPDHPEVLDWNEDIFGDTGRGCGGCGFDNDGRKESSAPIDASYIGAPRGDGDSGGDV